MNLTQKVMRLLAPVCEKQRMEFREELSRVEAHTEDLMRTLKFTPQQMREIQAKQK
jgi:hypothetical protein